MSIKKIDVVFDKGLSKANDDRFVVIDCETSKVLDNAQGYGYKSKQKAYAAWIYKNRDKSKDQEKKTKQASIRKWMKEHKEIVGLLDEFAFEIAKGSWGPDDQFDAKFIKNFFKENNIQVDFTASEFLKVYRSY